MGWLSFTQLLPSIAFAKVAFHCICQSQANVQDLAENGPVDKASAPKAAAKKGAQQAVDTIGESDISDDEDWPTDPAEAAKPPTTTAAAAASFTPSNLATLGQPTFQDEDDYDADEDAAPPSVAVSQAVLGVTQSASTLLPSSAALPGSSSLQAGIGAAQKVPAQPGAASVPSGAAAPAPAPPAELPQTSTQPAVPNVQQGVRRKTASLQQQVLLICLLRAFDNSAGTTVFVLHADTVVMADPTLAGCIEAAVFL